MSETYHNYTKGNVDFSKSETMHNLMRAFAGESQARNRYTFAASLARAKGLPAISRVFEFTAEQERAHAKVFYDLLKPFAGKTISVDGTYPVDIYPDVLGHLNANITDVPGFVADARNILFILLIPDDEAIIPAILSQPFSLR